MKKFRCPNCNEESTSKSILYVSHMLPQRHGDFSEIEEFEVLEQDLTNAKKTPEREFEDKVHEMEDKLTLLETRRGHITDSETMAKQAKVAVLNQEIHNWIATKPELSQVVANAITQDLQAILDFVKEDTTYNSCPRCNTAIDALIDSNETEDFSKFEGKVKCMKLRRQKATVIVNMLGEDTTCNLKRLSHVHSHQELWKRLLELKLIGGKAVEALTQSKQELSQDNTKEMFWVYFKREMDKSRK